VWMRRLVIRFMGSTGWIPSGGQKAEVEKGSTLIVESSDRLSRHDVEIALGGCFLISLALDHHRQPDGQSRLRRPKPLFKVGSVECTHADVLRSKRWSDHGQRQGLQLPSEAVTLQLSGV